MVSLLMIISKLIPSVWRVVFSEGGEGKEKKEVHTSFEYKLKKKKILKYHHCLDPALLTHCSSHSKWILRKMQHFTVAQSKVAKRLGSSDRPLKINNSDNIILTGKNTILNKC